MMMRPGVPGAQMMPAGGPYRMAAAGLPGRPPLQGRAPPQPRAQVDLSRVDTGLMTHNLYVQIVPPAESDDRSRQLTRDILVFITQNLPRFRQMGLKVNVNRVRSRDLQNPKLVAAMKSRGITRLPALTTPNDVYLGVLEIKSIYERNTKEFEAFTRREEKTAHRNMDAPENALDEFYRSDMTFGNAEGDASDEAIGDQDTESMMRSYSHMMQRREKLNKDRKGYHSGLAGRSSGDADAPPTRTPRQQSSSAAAPPRPAQSSRPDNVHQEGDDEEITSLISRINGEMHEDDTSKAFAGGGGDSLADDEGGVAGESGDAADRFMQKHWLENQEDSLR